MATNKLETASVLAFERKFDVSDAVFFQQDNKNNQTPLLVQEKSVRGTISNRLKNAIANDPVKLDAELEKANLQTVDMAMLDNDKDTVIVKWSGKVLPFTGEPSVCNDLVYQEKLTSTIQDYLHREGLQSIALRFANNILNGRWLWRNRMSAESIKIEVTLQNETSDNLITVPDAKSYSLNTFYSDNDVKKLANWIEDGLLEKRFIIFNIVASLKIGAGQEVYPSQELVLDTNTDKKNKKSKILYMKKDGQAGIHSQKIGNAIRTIDTWYEADAQFPIAIEPYGAVTTMGHAFRQPKMKNDFYTLFDNWILKSILPPIEQQHYLLAMLIRGGVFGASAKE